MEIISIFVNKSFTNMNRRLQQFLEAENITQAQFASKVKVAPASISHILAGRNKPGFDFIQNTIAAFPELNIDWLIMGRGKMYKQSSAPQRLDSPVGAESHENDLYDEDDMHSQSRNSKLDGLLFPIDDTPTPPESNISALPFGTAGNTQFSQPGLAQSPAPQHSVHQRKAIRIMVFYDDGTFQEFR